MLIDNDELVTMTIMTETKPGVPNINGVVYSKEAYDEIVKRMNEQQRFVPIIKEIKQGYCIGTAPGTIDLRKMCNEELGCKCLGSVTEIRDEDITAQIDKIYVDEVKELIKDGYKASMVYYADLDGNIVEKIRNILYFSLDKVPTKKGKIDEK